MKFQNIKRSILFICLGVISPTLSHAHEPIFGFGPRIDFKGAMGLQAGILTQKRGDEVDTLLEYQAFYAISTEYMLIFSMPQFLGKGSFGDNAASLGDTLLVLKHRFYRKDVFGGVYQAAAFGGVSIPTGNEDKGVGTGSFGFLGGLAADYEGRRQLHFIDARVLTDTDGNTTLFYDIAPGFRPFLTEYKQPDLVFLLELSGAVGNDRSNLYIGPTAWLTYRNWAFKPGIQLPLYREDGDVDFRAVFEVEFHFDTTAYVERIF
jgi:hypothetical protein